jgi:hypothetical protein
MLTESSEIPFSVSRERRDATVVIRGYVYQVNTTLLKWIGLTPGESLELEAGEDIDAVQQAIAEGDQIEITRLLQAVKHRERNLTLRSPEALAALATFQEHRHSNPSLKLAFRYITNSSIGAEKPPVTVTGTPGIHLWENVRGNAITAKQRNKLVSAIRTFLVNSACPSDLAAETWNSFIKFLKRSTILDFNRFIDLFEWSTNQVSHDDLEAKLNTN